MQQSGTKRIQDKIWLGMKAAHWKLSSSGFNKK